MDVSSCLFKAMIQDKYWDKIPVLLKGESELLWPFDKNDISNFLNL